MPFYWIGNNNIIKFINRELTFCFNNTIYENKILTVNCIISNALHHVKYDVTLLLEEIYLNCLF